MALRVFTNLSSLNAQRSLEVSRSQLGNSIERIASGIRINRASDDSAGLA
ncbi:MAG: flagellin FliC, partial [Nitrospinae bacterium]|nr:flagellin FliC [Nitrospinota bacterium]